MAEQRTARYGRGICHVCVREFDLKKDGTVRSHGDGMVFPPMNCSGTGEKPRAVVEGSQAEVSGE